jgi:outer membrane protein TolC
MRDSYRRCLLILGLGTTLVSFPGLPAAASEVPAFRRLRMERYPADAVTPTQPTLAEPEAPTADPGLIAETTPTPPPAFTLEPGEAALPLEIDQGTMPLSETRPGPAIPQSQRPTSQGFETPPDYLTPSPNPLLLPTQPEEVEILGTQPIALETAIDLAYRNNEELRIALLQLERSQAGLRAEQALLYPTADLNATLENTNQTNFGLGGSNNATRLSGGLRTEYDLGLSGERAARIRAAEEQVRLSELQVERTREELRLNTITDYYAVQEAIEQIRINQAFLTEAERNLRDTQLREEVGVGTRFDVLRADVQVANARQTLTQATSQRQIAQRQLARRLNVPPSIDLTTLAVEIAGNWPLTLEESIVLAYQNRSELEQFLVERTLNAAQREASLARIRPNLGLFAQYNAQTLLTSPAGVQNTFNDGFSLGAQLNWRLFDGGGARARADQSDRDIAIDEFEFESTRNTIRTQVEEAYYTLQANQANISTATVAVNQAEEALELANLRFNAGVGTQLDVLSATRELTEAQGNLVRAVLEYNRALARLERSVSNLD